MTIFTEHPSLRWSAPVVAVIVLGGGGVALRSASAAGHDSLPAKSAEQLLVDVQNARVDGLSGTIVEDADLGLPDLPISGGGNGSSKLSSLISGSHTMRVWVDGTDRIRLSLLGTLGESDVIRNGNDVWLWSSADHEATHLTLPQKSSAQPTPTPSGPAMTPQQLADHFLSAVQPSTKVTTDNTTTVAGRAAYDLVLSPRAKGSLIDSVHIAIDGETHVPLRVQVFSNKTENPAFQVGFSSVSFSRPDAAQFRFNPPPGTKVTNQKVPDLDTLQSGMTGSHLPKNLAAEAKKAQQAKKDATTANGRATVAGMPTVIGKDWTSVLKVKVPDEMLGDPTASRPNGHSPDSMEGFLLGLPHVRGDWGSGRLLRSNVMSALLTDSGTLYVGAVTPEVLYAAAGK